jgi:hypothetical protein
LRTVNLFWSFPKDLGQEKQTHDGRPIKMLTVIEEFSRESLATSVGQEAQEITGRWHTE